MRHKVSGRKLGRTAAHRRALLRNLAVSLIREERVRTTLPKAKELRPFAERLVTLARREGDRVHARRLAARDVHDPAMVKKLFDVLGARFATRSGGYTRILKLGHRPGDNAEMAVIEFLGSEWKPKGAKTPKGGAKETAAKEDAKRDSKEASKESAPESAKDSAEAKTGGRAARAGAKAKAGSKKTDPKSSG
jgi:large subunit ribosomal protein L17